MNLFLIVLMAATLPGFEDFQRVDRARRLTGQRLTDEWLRVSQVDSGLILRAVQQHSDDPKILWGAAELSANWEQRRKFFERALTATGTNTGIAVRFACAAAKQGDAAVAFAWLRDCQKRDDDNTAPWLAELWLLRAQEQPMVLTNSPPMWTTEFRDYSVEASRARIRLLEAAGYSPYAARRLGFSPDSPALTMARELTQPPLNEATVLLLRETSQALQRRPQFVLSELIGQTIERTLIMMRPDADDNTAVRYRGEQLDKRRDQLTAFVRDVERNTVDFATEAQMVQYFDDVLDKGEQAAMKKLAEAVRSRPSAP